MADIEVHDIRLGSPAASIVGIAQRLLEQGALDEETASRIRAIRELALEAVREAEGQAGAT